MEVRPPVAVFSAQGVRATGPAEAYLSRTLESSQGFGDGNPIEILANRVISKNISSNFNSVKLLASRISVASQQDSPFSLGFFLNFVIKNSRFSEPPFTKTL